mgnify:CR=1 FL=1
MRGAWRGRKNNGTVITHRFEILDEKPDVVDKPSAKRIISPTGNLTFKNVTFSYPNDENLIILDDFNLEINAGETIALVGRTGCGKSTVARLLPRFYDVTGGSILLDGTDIRDLVLEDLRTHINVIPDEPFLFADSIRNNIAFGKPDAKESEIIDVAKAAQADSFINHLENGYEQVVGERGYTLSGGQRQRVVVARTLLSNPKILVLDDSTSSIDVETESLIHASLKKLLQNDGTFDLNENPDTINGNIKFMFIYKGKK